MAKDDIVAKRKKTLSKATPAKKETDVSKHYGKGQGDKAFSDSPRAKSHSPGAKAKRHAAYRKLLAGRKKALSKK